MSVIIDAICSKCDSQFIDVTSDCINTKCTCGGLLERLWTLTPAPAPNCHPSERCVVYLSDKEKGRVQYPGRNDVPVPDRLIKRGYRKVEMNPNQLGAFERKHGVVNERRNYDRGSGRSYDGG